MGCSLRAARLKTKQNRVSTAFEGNENKDLVTTAKAPESDIVMTGTRLWARAEATLRLPWRPTVLGSPTWQHPRGGATRAERALKRLGAASSACVPPTAASALSPRSPRAAEPHAAALAPVPGRCPWGTCLFRRTPSRPPSYNRPGELAGPELPEASASAWPPLHQSGRKRQRQPRWRQAKTRGDGSRKRSAWGSVGAGERRALGGSAQRSGAPRSGPTSQPSTPRRLQTEADEGKGAAEGRGSPGCSHQELRVCHVWHEILVGVSAAGGVVTATNRE